MISLGIDPGQTGGAVFYDGERVVSCIEWRRSGGVYVCRNKPRQVARVDHLWEVAKKIELMAVALGVQCVVLEGMYVPKNAFGGGSVLRAAEARGILSLAHAMRLKKLGVEMFEPRPTHWRKTVFGYSPPRRAIAKRKAKQFAKAHAKGLDLLKSDHVCEAFCLARYGLIKLGADNEGKK